MAQMSAEVRLGLAYDARRLRKLSAGSTLTAPPRQCWVATPLIRISAKTCSELEALRSTRRYMQTTLIDPTQLFRLVHFFDILAAVVFAVSGALVASRKGLDVMGFIWFAVITGVGGGTVRDLVLNVPVFWVQNPAHVTACLVTALVMHFVAPRVESRFRTLLWFDAFGLALVTVAGTVKASDVGAPPVVATVMGAVTGCLGGIIRDTLGHVPSVLLGRQVYVTASVLGACTYVGLNSLGVGRLPAMIAGFLVTFTVRSLAIRYDWSLPVFRESTKRERWKTAPKDSAGD